MNREQPNDLKEKNSSSGTDENKKEAHNPFQQAADQAENEPTLEEEAQAEQQRKEALTERD